MQRGEFVDIYMDAQGRHYRALLNGRVLEGEDVLRAVAENTKPRPEYVTQEPEVPDVDAHPHALSTYFGEKVAGRPASAYMYRAEDGVDRGVRPLK